MVRAVRFAGVVGVVAGLVGACAGTACESQAETRGGRICPEMQPGSYAMSLKYGGESTFDGGCPSTRPFDGQTVTLTLDGQGGATLETHAATLACISFLSGECGLTVQCRVPPADQVELRFLVAGPTFDAGLLVNVDYLVSPSGPEGEQAAACDQSYLAEW